MKPAVLLWLLMLWSCCIFIILFVTHDWAQQLPLGLSDTQRAVDINQLSKLIATQQNRSALIRQRYEGPTRCFIYDRPPRTGSSTISDALETCLRGKDYVLAYARTQEERQFVVSHMLQFRRTTRGAVHSHVYMNQNDTTFIRQVCDIVLYVTSTNPMIRRIVSQVKYSLFEGHGNASVSTSDVISALQTRDFTKYEEFLERYPYVYQEVNVRNQLIPDYIIRATQLEYDLTRLLRALRCRDKLESQNVHSLGSNSATPSHTRNKTQSTESGAGAHTFPHHSDALMEQSTRDISLRFKDKRYKFLSSLVSNNRRGLIIASKF